MFITATETNVTDPYPQNPMWSSTRISIIIGTLLLPIGIILGLLAVLSLKLWVRHYMNKYRAKSQLERKRLDDND